MDMSELASGLIGTEDVGDQGVGEIEDPIRGDGDCCKQA